MGAEHTTPHVTTLKERTMRILLLGEYSNLHATLAEGFRTLGHEAVVISNGDFWKNYPRNIDLTRTYTKWGGIKYILQLLTLLPKMRNYDVVQLISPMFLELKDERIEPIYKYLRRNNKRIFLGATSTDWYYVNACLNEKPFEYSDFTIGDHIRQNKEAIEARNVWIGTHRERMHKRMARTCDGITAVLYEYWRCLQSEQAEKTRYIPLPIKPADDINDITSIHVPVKIFIGISKNRSEYKGTEIMLQAAQDIKSKYPEKVSLQITEGVPFEQYQQMMNGSDVILDQLYSYTPSMNSLLAMSKGIVVVGGGEPECYDILNEKELHPIINVQPNYESVYHELEQLVLHPERIPVLKQQSIEFVQKHHDYLKVAQKYLDFYNTKG